jgi:transposase
VERAEAEAIYDAGREVVVEVLLRMDRRIRQLEGRVEKLERELKRSSRNSSRPPSSDPPSSPARRGKDPSGRKRGGQEGHEGHGRPLLPAWAVDEVVEHWPECCRCGHFFAETERVAVDEPARHQVEELPPIMVRVIEHHAQRLRCPDCGRRACAQLPEQVAGSCFGARLQAAVSTLSIRNRVSRQDAVELTEELFGARVSAGSVDAIIDRTAAALEAPHAALLDSVRDSKALNMDETGWRTAGERRTLWGLFDTEHAYFQIAADRHEDRAKQLLGDTKAIVTSDRWWAYTHLPLHRRQICWAHLRRDFTAHAEAFGAEREFGEIGLELCESVFWAWEVFAHTRDRRELKRRVRSLQRTYKPLIRFYAAKRQPNKRCRGMAKNLLKVWPALWTFAKQTAVQPTNNHAERALRSAVIYRKISLGNQSHHGELRTSRLLSAHTTCRLQRRSLFAYLTDLTAAHARGDPAPLLS